MQYDVFISYSRKDYVDESGNVIKGSIVEKIKNLLKDNGISYWFDEDGINSGDEFAHLIANSIKNSKVLIFVSSENSNKSEWTRKEIATAISYKKKIIPFKYDDAPYDDSINFYISDFDYIAYNNEEKSFKRLVSSIKQYLEHEAVAANRQKIEKLETEQKVLEEKCNETVDKINNIEKEICKLDKNRKERLLEHLSYEKKDEAANLQARPYKKNGWLIAVMLLVLAYAVIISVMNFGNGAAEEEIQTVVEKVEPVVTLPEEKKVEAKPVKKELKDITVKVNGVSFDMIAVKGNGKIGDFLIGKFEVTQGLWKAVMGNTISQQRDKLDPSFKLRGEGDNMPMYYINWNDCQEFVKNLNSLTGKKFRMPSEAEWEYAANGGVKGGVVPQGWNENNSKGVTHLVGGKEPNALGLYDMSGNVSEWCKDKKGYEHVVKGGGWASSTENCKVTSRSYLDEMIRSDETGLRLVMD